MITSLSESRYAPGAFLKTNKHGLYKNSWLLVALLSLLLVSLSFLVSQKLFNYLVSASSYFTFLNWLLNLITYLIWIKKRNADEKYTSPLVFGKAGAYTTILIILFLFVISLRVRDFRMGFYAAALISIIISFTYIFVQKRG
jgi:L-asparagine transporter-like permease